MKRLGFIGLGAMGAPMARNLAAAGFELAVFDVDDPRTRAVAQDSGARAASSAADAASRADALVVMVTDASQAQAALFGGDVLLGHCGADALEGLRREADALGGSLRGHAVGVQQSHTGERIGRAGGGGGWGSGW